MILKTRLAGDNVLRQLSRQLTLDELKSDKVQLIIDSMIETLRDHPGVGLAAPQIGENLQIIIMEDREEYLSKLNPALLEKLGREPVELTVIVNPILSVTDETVGSYFEGCLSIPGYRALVSRAKSVQASGWDRHGNTITVQASGWYARMLQHETDHLSGELYVDKMNSVSFISGKEYALNWSDKLGAELAIFQKKIS